MDVCKGLLGVGGLRQFERGDIEGASARRHERNASRINNRAIDIASLYPVADAQDISDGKLREIVDVDETVAGDHLFHLPVKLGRGHEFGILPFGLDKMNVAVPEGGGKREVLTVA